jgi:DNA repair exonuclease SbcCD ATPase subunit
VIDPVTIAAAYKACTTAIDLAKKGVELYKQIKSTSGDVSDVLKELKEQYHKIVDPSPEQKKQYNEEVKRVQEVAKATPDDVLNDIWSNLGNFIDQYEALVKIYVQSEAASKEVYRGDLSLGRRALERIRLESKLNEMLAQVREQMVYNTPPELGSVWSRFEKAWSDIQNEQAEALAIETRKIQTARWQRRQQINRLKSQLVWIGAVVLTILWAIMLMVLIVRSETMRTSLGHY